jgi:viral A-type inclusion protein, putative
MTKVKVGLGCLLELLKKDPIVKIVSELPPKETAELNFIYLVPKDNAGQDKRAYVLRPDRSGYDAIDLSPQVIDVVGEGLITVKKEVHNENGDVTFTVTTSPSFQAVLDSLTAKDKELDTKVSALEAKDAVHEAKLSAIEAKDSEQDTKLEALKAHDDQVDDALEAVGKTIEKTVDLIDAKVLELKKDNERQDGAIDDLGESVKDLNESVQHLDEEHGKAIADLQKDSQGLKELTSELDNSINEINDQLKLLDGGLEEEVKAIHTEVEDITNAVTEIENRTDKLAKDAEDKTKAQAEKDGSQDAEIEALKKKDAEVETALETLGETLGKTVDLIDHKAQGLDTRVKALESKEDSDKQTLAIAGNKLSISNGNEVDLPQYDDTSVKDSIKQANDYTESVKNFLEGKNDALTTRVNVLEEAKPVVENKLTEIEAKNTAQDEKITALENRTDNFINNVAVSKADGKVKLTYSRVDGSSSEVEFEDSDTVTLAYDDEPLKTRIKALEDKEDKDTIYNDTEVKQGIKANESAIQGVEGDLTAFRTHTDARIEALENKEDKDTIYDDSAIRGQITALEGKVDGNKSAQDGKNTELENRIQALEVKPDKDTVYDDTALKAKDAELAKSIADNKADADSKAQGLDTRLQAIEAKEDNDKQTLSLTDHTLTISNGNSVELPKYDDTVVKAKNTEQDEELKALKEKTKSFLTGASVTRQGNVVTLTYTNIDGSSTNLEFNDNDTKAIAYDDTALKARVQDLENRADNDTIYNDAPIKERITALENKPDKDTVYDDAPLKERLTALETKVDKDTVYDDAEVKKLIQANKDSIATTDNMVDEHENKINTLTTDVEALKAKPDKDTIYDDSAVTARLTALETKEDKDTVYNDKELRDKITALEGKTDNFVSNVGVSREGNTVKLTYTMVNGDNKEVSFTDNDTVSVAYDDSALKGRVQALENKPEVEYELAKTTKAVALSQGEGVINLEAETTTDPLKELVLTGNVSAKVKSPFGGSETTVAGKVGFNSGATGDAISGSHTTAVSENVYVEFYYTDSTLKAYLVYEPDNENEVVKYRKALSLAELNGDEPARISISKSGVEQGYVEVGFSGVALSTNSYKVQKKG